MSEIRRRRPWLAVLLALLISGLGHAYLRRWARAFGWYVAITATLVFLVPDAAVDQLLAREAPPVADIAPGLLAVLASVVDAYVLAVRNNRRYDRQRGTTDARVTEPDADLGDRTENRSEENGNGWGSHDGSGTGIDGPITGEGDVRKPAGTEPNTVECPHCGKRTDADLDFCHWCTEPIDVGGADLDG
ncbi:DUF6677 family protein [Halorubrum sp. F4]|uniref:DUF7575 domain-containing protein n=1 Tax=Halorubrum sp. F4 TaxID=2989715 RepID=UPI002481006D|nr:DUF6677 family protein [Halorubrum sp. F4]